MQWALLRLPEEDLEEDQQKAESQQWPMAKLGMVSNKMSQRTEGRLNLNFQAHPYGVAFLNPWNMPKYPIKTLNSKIDFKALKRANFLSFFDKNILNSIFEFLVEFLVKFWCYTNKWSENYGCWTLKSRDPTDDKSEI